MAESLNEVLGKGKIVKLGDRSIPVVPATLEDLEQAMALWEKWINETNGVLQITYMADKKEAREAFEQLMFLACGKSIPIAELRKTIRVNMNEEVRELLDCFLELNWVFKPRREKRAAKLEATVGEANETTVSR
jgi:hypothetical protein